VSVSSLELGEPSLELLWGISLLGGVSLLWGISLLLGESLLLVGGDWTSLGSIVPKDLNVGHVQEVVSAHLHLKSLCKDVGNFEGVDCLMVSSVLLPHSSVEG